MHKPIYNSLGSNYDWRFAWLALKSNLSTSNSDLQRLKKRLSQDWGGEVVLTGKGRQAITVLLNKWQFGEGDVVLTQAFSCQAVEWGITKSGAKPIFVDTQPNQPNFGVEELSSAWLKHDLEQLLAQKHKIAVLVQHTLGNTASIAEIAEWCRNHQVLLIEDLAQGIATSKLQPEQPGSFGDGLILSFGQDKIIDAVTGGAMIDRTDSRHSDHSHRHSDLSCRHCGLDPQSQSDLDSCHPELVSGSRIDHSANHSNRWRNAVYPLITQLIHSARPLFLSKIIFRLARWLKIIRSPVLQTSHTIESLSPTVAPLIEYQLDELEKSVQHRRQIAKIYQKYLGLWVVSVDIDNSSCLRFNLLVPNPDSLINFLKSHQIYITDRWYRKPLDSGRLNYPTSYKSGKCPNSEDFCRQVVNLPTHQRITSEIALEICELIASHLKSSSTMQSSTNSVWEECADREQWETHLANFPEANFLQSWQWGEFQEKMGKTVVRLVLVEKNRVVAMFQAVVEPARRGRYLTIAGGPLQDWSRSELVDLVLIQARFIARQNHCHFVRFRPQEIDSPALRSLLAKNHVRPSPMHLTADLTLQLNLNLSEEELLKGMRKQTRQAIRKADQLSITTRISQDPAEIDQMYQDQVILAKKHGFVPFTKEFWQTQFQAFVETGNAWLVQAQDADGHRLATAFIIAYHGEAVYHYGTSTADNDKLPGSYACQWRAIREAKARGCQLYNMWGIAPIDQPNHRFAGVSTFKRGFGGQEVAYLPAHDISIDQSYWVSYIVEIMRRKMRRL